MHACRGREFFDIVSLIKGRGIPPAIMTTHGRMVSGKVNRMVIDWVSSNKMLATARFRFRLDVQSWFRGGVSLRTSGKGGEEKGGIVGRRDIKIEGVPGCRFEGACRVLWSWVSHAVIIYMGVLCRFGRLGYAGLDNEGGRFGIKVGFISKRIFEIARRVL